MKRYILIAAIPVVTVLVAVAGIVLKRMYTPFPHCDLAAVDNRLFDKYYGIQSSFFDIIAAENMHCSLFYTGHLPLGTLQKTSYFVY
jgi:hypothetical protein